MGEAELPLEDARVSVVLMVPAYVPERDAVHVLGIPEARELPGLFRRVEEMESGGSDAGAGRVAVGSRDGKHGGWIQPFLTGSRAVKGMDKARVILVATEGGGEPLRIGAGFEAQAGSRSDGCPTGVWGVFSADG